MDPINLVQQDFYIALTANVLVDVRAKISTERLMKAGEAHAERLEQLENQAADRWWQQTHGEPFRSGNAGNTCPAPDQPQGNTGRTTPTAARPPRHPTTTGNAATDTRTNTQHQRRRSSTTMDAPEAPAPVVQQPAAAPHVLVELGGVRLVPVIFPGQLSVQPFCQFQGSTQILAS